MSVIASYVPAEQLDLTQQTEFAADLHALVTQPSVAELLDIRHMWSVIRRHKTPELSLQSVKNMITKSAAREFGAIAIIDSESNRGIGVATSYPDLPLWRQRLSLPAGFTRNRLLGQPMMRPGEANVAAWAASTEPGAYLDGIYVGAYAEIQVVKDASDEIRRAWTIEPDASPCEVRHAITDAGLVPVSTGNYDDYELGTKVAPVSTLYVAR